MKESTRLSKGSRQLACLAFPFSLAHHGLPVSIFAFSFPLRLLSFSCRGTWSARARVCVIHHAKKPSVMNSPSCSIYATLKIDTWQIKESAPLLLETHFFHSVTLFFSFLLFLTLNSAASCCVRVFRGLSDSRFTEICSLLHCLSTLFSHFPTLSHSNALHIAFFLHQGSL